MKMEVVVKESTVEKILDAVVVDKVCSDWLSLGKGDLIFPQLFKRTDKNVIVDVILQSGKCTARSAETGLVIGSLSMTKLRNSLEQLFVGSKNDNEVAVRLMNGYFSIGDIDMLLKKAIR